MGELNMYGQLGPKPNFSEIGSRAKTYNNC